MRRAIFLDRDGVINALVYNREHGFVDSPSNPEQFQLLPGVGEAIKLINEMEFLVLVVSNQPGVAKGKLTLQLLDAITQKMKDELAVHDAYLDRIYYCLHHPDATLPEYKINCNCRKPKPGLLIKGCEEFNISPETSYLIGDGLTDIQAGKSIGCKTILLGKPKCDLCRLIDEIRVKPDFIAPNLLEAVRLIQKLEGVEKWRFLSTQQTYRKSRSGWIMV